MSHGDGGKGSERRPGSGFEEGWDRIFGRKPEPKPQQPQKPNPNSDFQNRNL